MSKQVVCLDTYHVCNWQNNAQAAILNPEASIHEQAAWLYGQAKEINDLLWGYLSVAGGDCHGETAPAMAHALCCLIESRTGVMLRLLENLCQQTDEEQIEKDLADPKPASSV